jgi:hypothetical protein
MTEKLLQFIWRYQYFNRSELRTEQGESIQVIEPGTWNTNQGPDFLGAKIRLNQTTWAGNIELHIFTSDWNKHQHFTDSNYTNIILHVVWKNEEPPSGPLMQTPVLELQSRVSTILLQRYEEWMNNPHFVPCGAALFQVNDLVWLKWKERLLIERLQRKSKRIAGLLQQNNNHWEESFWWLIARNFGIRINADAFEAIARSIPLNTLVKHKSQIHQLEALLFGQAGLLEKRFVESYPQLLQKEYRFYQKKYRFKKVFVGLKFLRMRPSAFPTVRLAQLARLIQQSTHLFARIRDMDSLQEIRSLLDVTANDYWHYHYRFDEESAFIRKSLGGEMVDNILVNTVIPVLFAYGNLQGESAWKDKVLDWMVAIRSEQNRITKGWVAAGARNVNAFDSQSLIELKTEYCDYKRCLDCAIGNALLKKEG